MCERELQGRRVGHTISGQSRMKRRYLVVDSNYQAVMLLKKSKD